MTTPTLRPALISSADQLKAFIHTIPPPSTLYFDLEGYDLGRRGTISIITILIHPENKVALIDVRSLGNLAFITESSGGRCLKSIFEDPKTLKCAWDVRNIADALWCLYWVGLEGVTDLQLLENASRSTDKTYLCELDAAVQRDLSLGFVTTNQWLQTKSDVKKLMKDHIFLARPMQTTTIKYCVNDVIHLPELRRVYLRCIEDEWLQKVMEETERRVTESHSPTYEPDSESKSLGPWGSGPIKVVMSEEELLERLEDERMDALEREEMMEHNRI
ncbi:hypothetical protein G7Z17_g2601 [Cylindrodendrum hubeiense]|uniref:3'-5' exonuclease domain-containing protein n=1 Tax=Cylindrodendrum hubeiense TaxID=595255 RepID=A0A9P5LIZ0_9HYPO|nr:hypothetical protein G7Z17_g2601 [Cylindrodendrum hubeiense]